MQYFFITGFLLTLFTCTAQCQTVVDITQIALMKPGNNATGVFTGDSSARCVAVLGEPDQVTDHYSEIDEDTLKLYKYGKNNIFFRQDRMVNWNLSDNSISVGAVNGQVFKVGDKLASQNLKPYQRPGTRTTAQFLNFLITHRTGISRNLHYDSASVLQLKTGSIHLDSRIELLFDRTNKLFSIAMLD
ncbi:hypothetical protein LXM25_21085 [Dyadobacter sp. LJ53]|uniref:hypothetical protein n=1 Tax=Dyadobacter chenwenxiniae TaxID=2906456 RepID=UPI001F3F52A4|nr:hypothetical protein [Dyadobacter chenwenxiniae]MCF0052579.1 hypothetical protein [Dyadobacter chenwenxiniae]